MKTTVILCTHNRCQSLAGTLESVAAQTLPKSAEWEVLVVDNNSSDQTREVVMDFCRRYPGRFRYLFEPKQGKSRALNAAIREARGDVLAFTDDDVKVGETWVQNLTAPLHSGEWAGVGGRVLPDRNFSPPRWVPRENKFALGPLAMFDLGSEAKQLAEPPFGNNMAIRKDMFEKYGGFRTDLGPCPGTRNPQKNEDVELGRRLMAGGERLRYEPTAVVYHGVPENRLQKRYFLAWWFDKARADIRELGFPAGAEWFVAGVPVVLLRRLVFWALRWVFAFDPPRRFSYKLNTWLNAGLILECYLKSRGTKHQELYEKLDRHI